LKTDNLSERAPCFKAYPQMHRRYGASYSKVKTRNDYPHLVLNRSAWHDLEQKNCKSKVIRG